MNRKVAVASFIMALLFSVVCLMFVGLSGANPLPAPPILEVYIRSDGSIDPSAVPIQREGNIYTFTGDLTNSTITVECDNIVIDGAGFKLQGNGEIWNTGLTLTSRSNVIIKNIDVRHYWKSITLTKCSGIIIFSNNMLTSWNVLLDSSFRNQIVGNNITGEDRGFGYCVNVENGAADNLIVGNNFVGSGSAVTVYSSSGKNNTFYHNNFIDNKNNVYGLIEEGNPWDNGTEGNFWSDYKEADVDGDGIVDTPYMIKNCPPDRHPLMAPFNVSSVTVEMPEWANTPDPPEPFPAVSVVAASAAVAASVSAGILVYFKKRKH